MIYLPNSEKALALSFFPLDIQLRPISNHIFENGSSVALVKSSNYSDQKGTVGRLLVQCFTPAWKIQKFLWCYKFVPGLSVVGFKHLFLEVLSATDSIVFINESLPGTSELPVLMPSKFPACREYKDLM